ncbi:MAG: WYL domain-containing protein [Ginsengibacter sp.]
MEETRTKRILRLLMMLSGSKLYSIKELENKLGISHRTIFRDFETIEESGFILERSTGYRLQSDRATNKSLKNLLHFSEEEISILYQTLSHIEGDSPVKERLVRKLNAFYDLKALEQLKQNDDLTKVHLIRDSMEQKKQVTLLAYRSSNSNSIENREVEVFEFLPDYRAIWCYDLKSNSCKQFKIARMQSVELLTTGWRYEEKHQKPFTDMFRVSASRPMTIVELRLSLKAYNLLIEEYSLTGESIKEENKQYRLKVPVANYDGIGRFVLGLMEEVEIIRPVAFKKYLNKKVEKFLK